MTTQYGMLGGYPVGGPGLAGEFGFTVLFLLVLLLLYGAYRYQQRGGTFVDGLAAAYLGLASLLGAAIALAGVALMVQSLLLFVAPVPASAVPCFSIQSGGSSSNNIPPRNLLPGPGTNSPFTFPSVRPQPQIPIPGNGCGSYNGHQDSNVPNVDAGPPLARGLGLLAAGLIFLIPHALIWRARPRLRSAEPVRTQLGGAALIVSGLATLGALLMTAGGLIATAIYVPHLSPGTYAAIGTLIAFGPAFGFLLVQAFPLKPVTPPPPAAKPEPATPAPSAPPTGPRNPKPKPRPGPRAAARKRSTPQG